MSLWNLESYDGTCTRLAGSCSWVDIPILPLNNWMILNNLSVPEYNDALELAWTVLLLNIQFCEQVLKLLAA